MTELVERYRRNAEKCLQLVQNFNDLEAKRSLLAMANAWLMLAAQREKNIQSALAHELTSHEPTSPINEPPPPPHEPPKPPPIKEPPPADEPPQRLDAAKRDDSMQC